MTNEEKIKTLIKLRKLNFKFNFFLGKGSVNGLCELYYTNCRKTKLRHDIPELYEEKTLKDFSGYWWTKYGRFKPWYERRQAINRTIEKIKQNAKSEQKELERNLYI